MTAEVQISHLRYQKEHEQNHERGETYQSGIYD